MIVHVFGARGVVPTHEQMVSFSVSNEKHTILVDLGSTHIFSDEAVLRNTKTILLSHHHHDHIAMLPHFVLAQIFRGVATESNPTTIISPEDILQVMMTMGLEKSRAYVHTKEVPKELMGFKLEHTVTNHPIPNYAYKFQVDQKKVVYTGDTSFYPDLPEFCRGADLLIVEASYKDESADLAKLWGHMTPSMVADLVQKSQPHRVLLIHLVHVDGDEFAEHVSSKLDCKCEILVAHDGLTLSV